MPSSPASRASSALTVAGNLAGLTRKAACDEPRRGVLVSRAVSEMPRKLAPRIVVFPDSRPERRERHPWLGSSRTRCRALAMSRRFTDSVPRESRWDAVAAILLRDARRNRVCRRDIGLGAGDVGFAPFGEATTVERMGLPRFRPKRRVIVLDGSVDLTELEIDEGPAIEGVAVLRSEPQRLVAVLEGGVQVTGQGSGKTASVPGRGVAGTERDGLVEIQNRPVQFTLVAIGVAPVAIGQGESRGETNGQVIVLNRPVQVTKIHV